VTALRKLGVVFAVQALLLLAVVGFKQYATWTADTVVLALRTDEPAAIAGRDSPPVEYKISTLRPSGLAGDGYPSEETYVELREGADGQWDAVAISWQREHVYDSSVLIKGTVDISHAMRDSFPIDYDIEDVYVPDSEAARLPSGSGHSIAVEVKVDRFGNATPQHFLIDGERFDLDER
jgi:hypothetical protein